MTRMVLIMAVLAACSDKAAKPTGGDPPTGILAPKETKEACPLPATIAAAVPKVRKVKRMEPNEQLNVPKGAYIVEFLRPGIVDGQVELHLIGDLPTGRSEMHAYKAEAKGPCQTAGCVQVMVQPSGWGAIDSRRYVSVSGTVEIEASDGKRLAGSVSNVELAEHEAKRVEGGCTARLEKLSFDLDLTTATPITY